MKKINVVSIAVLFAIAILPVVGFCQDTVGLGSGFEKRKIEIEIPYAGKLDLQPFIAQARISFVYSHHGQKLLGAHLPVASLHTKEGAEVVNVNVGVIWDLDGGAGGPFVAAGVRLDNAFGYIKSKGWLSEHMTSMAIPAVEVGPFAGFIHRIGWLYGVFVSKSFG